MKIYVKDSLYNVVHEVGTDRHDSLIVENGCLYYYNLQNGEGTRFGGYKFCDKYGNTNYNNKEYDNYYHIGFSCEEYEEKYNNQIKGTQKELEKKSNEENYFMYGHKERTATEFVKKNKGITFSKAFPSWHTTKLSAEQYEKYGFSLITMTRKPLSDEIVERYGLTFVGEKNDNKNRC